MAKMSKRIAFKNATIDVQDMTVTEILKDEEKSYNLKEVLESLHGIPGIAITFSQEDELPQVEDELE